MRACDGKSIQNASTLAPASTDFSIFGGYYVVSAHADTWNSGSITLNQYAGNGTTKEVVNTSTADAISGAIALPPGNYNIGVSGTITGVYYSVWRVPTD